jgi:hypothetical protein
MKDALPGQRIRGIREYAGGAPASFGQFGRQFPREKVADFVAESELVSVQIEIHAA